MFSGKYSRREYALRVILWTFAYIVFGYLYRWILFGSAVPGTGPDGKAVAEVIVLITFTGPFMIAFLVVQATLLANRFRDIGVAGWIGVTYFFLALFILPALSLVVHGYFIDFYGSGIRLPEILQHSSKWIIIPHMVWPWLVPLALPSNAFSGRRDVIE